MQLSDAGLTLLKFSEGFRSKVYLDIAGFPTIGYGHRLVHNEQFPAGITEPEGSAILVTDVQTAEDGVTSLVKVPLSQGQFDALVDCVFNLGARRLAGSTLLKLLNSGHYDEAAIQLLAWDHSGLTEVAALKIRREAEYKLWKGNLPTS